MSNVIQLNARRPGFGPLRGLAALIDGFASHRRFGDDVFWLKENAELLNILECTGQAPGQEALEPHLAFYTDLPERLRFFPQYYRFLLSICLDLEDLGMPGGTGAELADWVAGQRLPEAELSDLQRAEARRLLARRGVAMSSRDAGLTARLHDFISRSQTFALPNKKAAYELSHIVFYLSEYGRRAPDLPAEALVSLEYAGLLAYLEQNADLLAEICVAMRYAGATPSPIWENWLAGAMGAFSLRSGAQADMQDDYHEYLVCAWAGLAARRGAPAQAVAPGPVSFHRTAGWSGPLREISECIYRMGAARSGDWHRMRPQIAAQLSETGHDILTEAEASSPRFDAFFAGFARSSLLRVAG
ncbi:hypothetical protein KBY28_11120 [Ruegeria pomeroyi]|uniref:DUF6902 family protein n=1 Tax=Ruegeria pomeroyi TaxID=89184 RepID=UPI001F3FCD21|nr:hypothetical protein [Ruegeria pomeroyi]MCE8508999.1 hypothetical protein [Ruegeria pomeroyi]